MFYTVCWSCLNCIGKNFFTWMGTRPVVHFLEPTMIREALANYNQFQKPKRANPLAKLLATGLIEADGDRWAKHRKIINPAFHVEKLKVSCFCLFSIHCKMYTYAFESFIWVFSYYLCSIWYPHFM